MRDEAGLTNLTPRHRHAVTAMVTDEVVRDVATILAQGSVEVMPVKGALLQHWLYDDPADRPRTDVDLLVKPERLLDAHDSLCRAGYTPQSQSTIGAHVFRSPLGLAVDVHPHLFDPARYRLHTEEVFHRGAADESLFGVRVRVPSRLDAYAHLLGKFASDHRTHTSVQALDEVVRLGQVLSAEPRDVARHLEHTGMRRAARYALSIAARRGDQRAAAVLSELDPDPVGMLVVSMAGSVLRVSSPASPLGSVAAHAMNHSLASAAHATTRAVLRRALSSRSPNQLSK